MHLPINKKVHLCFLLCSYLPTVDLLVHYEGEDNISRDPGSHFKSENILNNSVTLLKNLCQNQTLEKMGSTEEEMEIDEPEYVWNRCCRILEDN